jgi:hypothetical protein
MTEVIHWKGSALNYAIAPAWSRPTDKYDNRDLGPARKARPLKHWRKQLKPQGVTGSSRSSMVSSTSYPNSTMKIDNNSCACDGDQTGNRLVLNLDTDINNKTYQKSSDFIVIGPNDSRVCVSCNPERNIIKSGLTEKRINPQSSTEIPTRKYCFDTKSYLKSRVLTYEQRLTGSRISGIDYVVSGTTQPIYPTDSSTGTQNRNSLDCSEICNQPITIIYKPNNPQYAQQGAVSSSSRLARLKLNSINKHANSLRSSFGDATANASKYNPSGNAPFTTKSITNTESCRIYHRNGQRMVFC